MQTILSFGALLLAVGCSAAKQEGPTNDESGAAGPWVPVAGATAPGPMGGVANAGGASGAGPSSAGSGLSGGTGGSAGQGATPITAFVRAQGTKLIAAGQPIQLKGIAFANWVIAEDDAPASPWTHNNESHYALVKSWGMNVVRFYLHEKTVGAGYDWIDANVEWAKKAGVYLIVNMHVPPGGWQNPFVKDYDYGMWDNPALQDQFVQKWVELATRYKDEPTIAGWGLLNEPCPRQQSQWATLASRTIQAVRAVDKNHLIAVERVPWEAPANANMGFPVVADDNVMYEFHFYEPFPFTGQVTLQGAPQGSRYPDPSKTHYLPLPTGETPTWTKSYVERALEQYAAAGAKLGRPLFMGEFGVTKSAYDDDLGATAWTRDVAAVAVGKGMNLTYHAFHEDTYGVYLGWLMDLDLGYVNQKSYDVVSTLFK